MDFNINVYTYYNNRLRLKYSNINESHDITINLSDFYLEDGKVFLDPAIKNNGILHELIKKKIIKEISSSVNYNYVDIPIATINLGVLSKYDLVGLKKHISKVTRYGK